MSDTWYKVDNVAKVFLAAYNRRDPRVFRISCTLKEKISQELLQQALEKTIQELPQFQVRLHRGVFWHYMEETAAEPKVREEHLAPCSALYGPSSRGKLHYRVVYFGNRITLEVFHAISDGNGGVSFMNVLVQNYLQLSHPGELNDVSVYSGASADDLGQDSFRQFFKKHPGNGETIDTASASAAKDSYRINSLKLPYYQERFYEIHLPTQEILKRAKETGTSLTSYLGARLMLAIYAGMPAAEASHPITIGLPVNLRNYYPSQTLRNFFNTVFVSHVFSGDETIETLAAEFETKLREAVLPEHIRARMDHFEKLEQQYAIKAVPLIIKDLTVRYFTRKEDRNVTATLSNLGRLKLDEQIRPYVDSYAAYCSTSGLFITTCSLDDDLVLGVSSCYRSSNVLQKLVRDFTKEGIEAVIYATDPVM